MAPLSCKAVALLGSLLAGHLSPGICLFVRETAQFVCLYRIRKRKEAKGLSRRRKVLNMDTKSLIAIVCVVIAIVILLSLTIYTVVIAWKKISREYEERQDFPTAAPHSYENMECIKNEQAASENNFTENTARGTSSEYEQITTDHCQTADSNARAEVTCTHSDQSAGKGVLVHVETNDTSF
ncbi:hypothetical protein ACROYT_G008532 [Oculina patagonica]